MEAFRPALVLEGIRQGSATLYSTHYDVGSPVLQGVFGELYSCRLIQQSRLTSANGDAMGGFPQSREMKRLDFSALQAFRPVGPGVDNVYKLGDQHAVWD
jgi:hypothetical protein